MQSNANVLQVENIITRFNTQDGKVFAVNGISFDLKEGELLGVVGESGSGKSVTMMSLLKLLPMPPAEIVEGRALFENQDLIQMDLYQLRKIRGGKIGFIFQDPMTSLNPVLNVGYQLMEPMREHLGLSREEARNKAIELLELVGIPMAQSRLKDFPHQFSGLMSSFLNLPCPKFLSLQIYQIKIRWSMMLFGEKKIKKNKTKKI